jgi:hypothetical protein
MLGNMYTTIYAQKRLEQKVSIGSKHLRFLWFWQLCYLIWKVCWTQVYMWKRIIRKICIAPTNSPLRSRKLQFYLRCAFSEKIVLYAEILLVEIHFAVPIARVVMESSINQFVAAELRQQECVCSIAIIAFNRFFSSLKSSNPFYIQIQIHVWNYSYIFK